ncbi:hypothetical protein K503DRAFT_419802 [Rhizopogon vinicolor AM-OR11-026]|uniref:Uncharacterized protein n=1 Tax=Rhizopogon vinicolor AM-OR11-026 TaxID=1314800 RepID=A0A1B7MQ88_9AGAM|nr:hypothetical protein K503DRAFT_419802 [Rhizopogon vinicolor AM-OR11-026]
MSQVSPQLQVVAVPSASRERGGHGITLVGYPSSVHASKPLRSSPLARPALSSASHIQSTSTFSLDVPSYSRSTSSSIASHSGSLSASTSSFSSHAHRAPGAPAAHSKSTSSIPTLNLDSRPYSSPATSTSSFSSHAHSPSRPPPAQVKSSSSIPTLSLFRRQVNDDPSPPPPTQPSLGHNRSATISHGIVSPPEHIPKTYSPRTSRPSTAPGPSVSRNPTDNWMSSSPFGPANTPRFSRQSMSSQPIVMPLRAHEYRRQKCPSIITNAADPVKPYSPATEGAGIERVNNLPHIIVSDSESSRTPTSQSGNRSTRRASSPSLPCTTVLRSGSPEPQQLSARSSISTFFSVASENESENAVITVVDPGVTPRRRRSTPNATPRHSRLSLVDAVNRLSQVSTASGDTEFFDTEDSPGVRQIHISMTEDDGVLRRASSRRRNVDVPARDAPSVNLMTAPPTIPQEHTRMVGIAEACEDKSQSSALSSKFSDSSHDCQQKGNPECGGEVFPDGAASQSKQNLTPPGPSSPESLARRRKLTKSRTQSVQAPKSPLPWIPSASPFFKVSAKQNAPTASISDTTMSENVQQSHETGDSGKDNKRRTRRLTFQFIPSPSFHKRPKTAPGVDQSLDLKPPTMNETRQRMSRPESGFGTDSTLSSLTVTQGSATTITLMPPPPITSSSSVSSSAANSTSSLIGSSTIVSRDTSATSIVAPSLSRLGQPYFMVPSNLKESNVAQSGDGSEIQEENLRDETTTPPPAVASHEHEPQETSSSISSVSSYVSFSSVSTPGFIPTAQDTKHLLSPRSRPEAILDSHTSIKQRTQAPDSNYLHPMWMIPMTTITATSATSPINEISPAVHESPVRPTFITATPPAPTSKTPSARPHTTRLKRPRPQTAPSSPSLPVFPTPPSVKLPRAHKAPSGFKSLFRSLMGRAG